MSLGYCPDCEREWSALGEAHCAVCCRHFTSDSAFTRHRVKGECVDPATILDKDDQPLLEVITRASGEAWKWAGETDHIWAASTRGEQNPAVSGLAS